MDAAASFFQNLGSSPDWHASSVKNFNLVSPVVQQHLLKVYKTLAAALIISALGVYVHILLGVGGLLTAIGFIGSALWLMATPSTPSEEGKRLKLLAAAAAFQGASLGPLVELVLDIDGSILVTAFVGTGVVFACFSGAALFARRREFLFLGGILSSVISTFMWLRFASMLFGGSSFYYNLELYVGLMVFLGYVLFDTQLIIEKADHGDRDYVKHSLDLFVDFAAIFVRILVILTKNSSERAEKGNREKRSNQRRR